ncbi:PadR family transcriptional regulator [Fournierella sp.]|uniref:PadR family transcriptional regulator n=1 Tax=Allofournierella sp. TaxID=1940256 RepID=UPI0030795E0B
MRTLKYAILGMLSRRELTGYDMMKEFDRGLANFWYASHSQLYPELNRLAGEGLIQYETSIKGESLERKVYRITPDGMADLRQWLEQDEPLPPTPKDVFRLRMYFGDNISRSRLLELTRAQLERRRQKLAFLQNSLDHTEPYTGHFDSATGDRLVLEGAVMRESAMVQWLEHCIETLEHCESEG